MYTREFNFENGDQVKEKITGYEGIVTGTCFYITGCNQYLVTGKATKDQAEPPALWYDEGRLELIASKVVSIESVTTEDPGCDKAPPMGKRGA